MHDGDVFVYSTWIYCSVAVFAFDLVNKTHMLVARFQTPGSFDDDVKICM